MADDIRLHQGGGHIAHPTMFRESDTVPTTRSVECDGKLLPSGSEGTVIDVSPIAGRYGIEFLIPFHCVIFLNSTDLT